ncbi:MAG TPA: alpha/beta hydrolase [Chitinophagaceae bacterium]|nr:alpha/beta hydrolase [Chitinophagaceae bacterium]
MKSLQFNDRNTGEEISLAYSDYGTGQPVIFIHGWPSSREMWEYQLGDIVDAGYRVIKYDRRGFGKSSKPWSGYDYDTLSADLNELITGLQLEKVILVGFSMGGGEVARYIANYGQDRIDRIVLISSVLPYMLKTADNPEGVDKKVFDEMEEGIKDDRIGFLDGFGKTFFGMGLLNKPLSAPLLDYYLQLTTHATQQSTLACARSFATTDFRNDIKKITVPTLIIHGDSDKIVPYENSSKRTAVMLPHAELIIYADGPHGIFYTHRQLLNKDLLNFFAGVKHVQPIRQTVIPTPL